MSQSLLPLVATALIALGSVAALDASGCQAGGPGLPAGDGIAPLTLCGPLSAADYFSNHPAPPLTLPNYCLSALSALSARPSARLPVRPSATEPLGSASARPGRGSP